jgi:hypothetical protein
VIAAFTAEHSGEEESRFPQFLSTHNANFKPKMEETIVKKKLGCSLLCLALLMLASMTALAADDTGITLNRDGRLAIATKAPATVTPAHVDPPATISGNLSTYPFGTFFCCFGNTIAGINSALGFEVWVAIPFTPAANVKVHKIEASVGWIENTDTNFLLSVYNDSNGVPGTAIKKFKAVAANEYGACCTLVTGSSSAGISVTGGKQYWLVVSTDDKNHGTFFGAWAFNSTDMRSHPIASWCKSTGSQCGSNNGIWVAGMSGDPLPAYGVLGK